MKNKRLSLETLKVKSFVTPHNLDKVKGGHCTELSLNIFCEILPNDTIEPINCCPPSVQQCP